MLINIGETEIYVFGGIIGLSLLLNFLSIAWGSNYLLSVAKMKLFKKPMALVGTIKGEAEFRNYKYEAGWLRGKEADYQITERSISKMKNSNYLFILHENLGMSVPLEVSAAITYLSKLGYKDLPSVINDYDEQWLITNQETINKELATQNKDKEGLIVKKIIAAGRNALLKLEWPTNFTIPLAIVHGWAYQTASAFNNKVIVQRAEINIMKKMMSGVNIGKVVSVIIAGSVAIAILLIVAMIYQQGIGQGTMQLPSLPTQSIQAITPP